MEREQGKPSPYETRELFAKKTKIYGIALQSSAQFALLCGFLFSSY
jgi:hypothetical protein